MKAILKISILSTLSLLFMNGCYKCYSCIAKGDNFNTPYDSTQTISFINDSLQINNYTIKTEVHLPPSEYCGSIGSTSYGDCAGDLSATFIGNEEDNISIKIYYNTMQSDNVELPVYKNVIINKCSFVILNNKVTTSDIGCSTSEYDSFKFNEKNYSNVVEYINRNETIKENACIYILYSKSLGLLSFHIKRANSIENWTLKN